MPPDSAFTHKSPPGHIVSVNEYLCLLVAGQTRRGARMTITTDTHVAARMIGPLTPSNWGSFPAGREKCSAGACPQLGVGWVHG